MREARSPRLREAGRPPRGGHTPAAREQPRRGPRRWQRHPPASVAVTAQTIRPPGILPASQLSRHGAETQGRPPRLARSADLCRIENKGVLCLGRRHEDPGRPLGTRRARAGAGTRPRRPRTHSQLVTYEGRSRARLVAARHLLKRVISAAGGVTLWGQTQQPRNGSQAHVASRAVDSAHRA